MEINSHIFPHLEFLKLSLYFVSGRLTATTTSFSRTLPVSGWRVRRMPDYVDQTRSTCSTQPNVRSCRTARASWSFNSTIVLSRSGKELNIGDNIRTSTLRRTRIKDLSSSFDDSLEQLYLLFFRCWMENRIGQIHRRHLLYNMGQHLDGMVLIDQSHREPINAHLVQLVSGRTFLDRSNAGESIRMSLHVLTRLLRERKRFRHRRSNASLKKMSDKTICLPITRWRSASFTLEMRFSTRFN